MRADGKLSFETTVTQLAKMSRWVDDGFGDFKEVKDAGQLTFQERTGDNDQYAIDDPIESGWLVMPLRHMKHLRINGKIRVTVEILDE